MSLRCATPAACSSAYLQSVERFCASLMSGEFTASRTKTARMTENANQLAMRSRSGVLKAFHMLSEFGCVTHGPGSH